jgi:hypothetical protein
MGEGLVQFVQGGHDNRLFSEKNVLPLRTTGGWTADCFLVRFRKFEDFLDRLDLVQVSNPINWLEAELEDEVRLEDQGRGNQVMRPWKGRVDGDRVQPVVDWDTLRGLKWEHQHNCYPKPFEQPVSTIFNSLRSSTLCQ